MTTLRMFVNDFDAVVGQLRGNIALKLAKGSCPTMEMYNRECGRSEGMALAVQAARDMLTKMAEDAENDGLPEMKQ